MRRRLIDQGGGPKGELADILTRNPTVRVVDKLAKALGAKPGDLLD